VRQRDSLLKRAASGKRKQNERERRSGSKVEESGILHRGEGE